MLFLKILFFVRPASVLAGLGVALNPIIKFTTRFGLLAIGLAVVFFLLSLVFVHRSFFSMRIAVDKD